MGQSPAGQCMVAKARDGPADRFTVRDPGSCGCLKPTYSHPWPSGRFIPPPTFFEDDDEPDTKSFGWTTGLPSFATPVLDRSSKDPWLHQRQVHRVQAKIDKVMLTPLQFRDGSADLDPVSMPQVKQVSQLLKECPDFGISIQGVFGQPGGMWASAEKCTQVAQLRVSAIREALWQEGSMNPVAESGVGNANSMEERVSFIVVAPTELDETFLRPKPLPPVTVRSTSPITLTSAHEDKGSAPRTRRPPDLSGGSPGSAPGKRKASAKKKANPASSDESGEAKLTDVGDSRPVAKKRARSKSKGSPTKS